MAFSLILDVYGLFGFERRGATAVKCVGIGLVFIGAALVQMANRFNTTVQPIAMHDPGNVDNAILPTNGPSQLVTISAFAPPIRVISTPII
jgi:hypothetical protein